MIFKLVRRIFFCGFNFHVRSRKLVTVNSDGTKSRCKYCDRPMRKDRSGKWEPDNS